MAIETRSTYTVDVDYHELCGALAAKSMQPLWKMKRTLLSEVPLPTTQAWLWKWATILPLAQRAGEVVTLDRGGDRRVLALANPGLEGLPFTTKSLWGAIQYLGGNELAPSHRHTPAAIRFVMSGSGATTTVDGDVCTMNAGDLVLTPNGTWHEHRNESADPVVWFDGLDLPMVSNLEAIFFENHPDDVQEVRGKDLTAAEFTAAGIAPLGRTYRTGHSPMMRYPWEDTDRALSLLADAEDGPLVSIEFTDPTNGGPAVPTLGCEMHRLRPGARTKSHRKVGSSIFVVYRGSGTSVIAGEAFEWGPGDVFAAPSWAAVDHQADEPADLFALTDRPVLQQLHLYREEELAEQQEVRSTFVPAGPELAEV
jgi:gentisate 1,2-dioxygenase